MAKVNEIDKDVTLLLLELLPLLVPLHQRNSSNSN